jgi:hypothetical protein
MQVACQTPTGLFSKGFCVFRTGGCDFLRALAKIVRCVFADFLRDFAGDGVKLLFKRTSQSISPRTTFDSL